METPTTKSYTLQNKFINPINNKLMKTTTYSKQAVSKPLETKTSYESKKNIIRTNREEIKSKTIGLKNK